MTDNRGNTGNYNTGYRNTGDCNTGNCNTGDYNTGYRNTGDYNTGYRNTGYYNTGDCNTGDYNTGNYNTGYRNTGDYNTGDYNTGYCNSISSEECCIFNKPAKRQDWLLAGKPSWLYVGLTIWVAVGEMNDKEKEAYPSYITTGGYLKCYPDLRSAFIKSWENTTEEDRELTKKLPNFDADVFEEVFGFQPFKGEVSSNTPIDDKPETIVLNGKTYKLIEEIND